MAKLSICRGLPGSGKSTWARLQVNADTANTVNVCRDNLREMMHDSTFIPGETEQIIIAARDAIIEAGLKAGKHVISSDTNLKADQVKQLLKIAQRHNAPVEFVDFDTDVEECIKRDSLRTGKAHVGESVIRDMHERFFHKGKLPKQPELIKTGVLLDIEPYIANKTLPKAIIVDLDGTLAHNNGHRSHYDYTLVSYDEPRSDVIAIVEGVMSNVYKTIFVSGREDYSREDTLNWLDKHVQFDGNCFELYMRKTGDYRTDYVIKYEIFDEHIRNNYNVLGAFDDRPQVLRMWRKLGITTFDVGAGVEF